jgi:maleate isomerase
MSYGHNGIIGTLTPQANTTVEPEFWCLLPSGWSMLNARLTSTLDTIEKRLVDYTDKFDATASHFGNAPLSAIAIACTGASYLIGSERESAITASMQQRLGIPCITAAQATVSALRQMQVERLALLTPYPESLNKTSIDFWQSHGFNVVATAGPSLESQAFHPIYAMAENSVCQAYETLSDSPADAVLMLGTGMATLGALLHGRQNQLMAAISCNLALAWACVNAVSESTLNTWLAADHWHSRFEIL